MENITTIPERRNDPENSGLSKAIKLLSPIVEKYPWLSTADIWILAGYVAIETTGGPPATILFWAERFL